jgi:flagellar assembly protein FliH
MTSTSSDGVVLRGLPEDSVNDAGAQTDLRTGGWTRLGDRGVLGDPATETALQALAERTREAARAQGYASGWAEGRRVALANAQAVEAERTVRHEAEHAAAMDAQRQAAGALGAATDRLVETLHRLAAELSGQAVEVALQVAEAVVGHEIACATDPGGDALRRAMTAVPPLVPVVVRMNPADRARVDLTGFGGRDITLVDDPTLAPGDALVETENGVVDATIAAALARVREVLCR